MISEQQIQYLNLIFSDADIIDIDFSHWDESVDVYVMADHVPHVVPGKRTLLAVRFRHVRRFDCSFCPHDFTKFTLKTQSQKHLNWYIYRIHLVKNEISKVTLSGSEQFPILKIEFEDFDTENIDHSLFTEVNPDWAESSSGLARPGIKHLHALFKRKNLTALRMVKKLIRE